MKGPEARIRHARAFSKIVGLGPRVELRNDLHLVTVDFIGRNSTKRSIPCPEDDDGNPERGGEGSTHAVDAKACASLRDICFGSCGEARDHPPR